MKYYTVTPIVLLVLLCPVSVLDSQAQREPNRISITQVYPLNQGMMVLLYEEGFAFSPNACRPLADRARGFILQDSVAYLVNQGVLDKGVFLQEKVDSLQAHQALLELRIDNLLEQKQLFENQLLTEQKAFETMQEVSQLKDDIAVESIEEIKKLQRRGKMLGIALGTLGGLLWVREDDTFLLGAAKTIGVGGAGYYISIPIFN